MAFDVHNTDGYNASDLELLNSAHDAVWGAIKGWSHRLGEELNPSLHDAVNERVLATFDAGEHDVERIENSVLTGLGFVPRRSIYGLEAD